jgi:hypothetical protein
VNNLAILCADIGSVAKKRFAWAELTPKQEWVSGTDIEVFAARIADNLDRGNATALGFECPLYVPIAEEPERLTSKRSGEGNRPWCAGAGSGALATGLAEVAWLLETVQRSIRRPESAYLRWPDFTAGGRGLFLWEAFVSGTSKRESHEGDATAAVEAFHAALPDPHLSNALTVTRAFSLIGAAMLRTGWGTDLSLLAEPCLVIRATDRR